MKVLFDNQIFALQRYGGISRYYADLMRNAGGAFDHELSRVYCGNDYLRSLYPSPGNYSRLVDACLNNRLVRYNDLQNIRLLKRGVFDIFHPTYFDPYFLKYLGKKPFVAMVPDMIYELFPGCFSDFRAVAARKKALVEKAATVITISDNTKGDICRLYDVSEAKVHVAYPGNSLRGTPVRERVDESVIRRLPERYLLFVGKRGQYKNFDFFLAAVAPLLGNDKDLCVVCAGGGPFTGPETELMGRLGVAGRVFQCTLNDDTLIEIYRHAVAFVFPSRYEGFGFPVLEAFACGCPAVLSNRTSLPEIGGDAAAYFDPDDGPMLRSAVGRVLEDDGYRRELTARGFRRCRRFSWQNNVREQLSVFEGIARR
jgi:glycosyltransferase involved in cell wall biosynthesis